MQVPGTVLPHKQLSTHCFLPISKVMLTKSSLLLNSANKCIHPSTHLAQPGLVNNYWQQGPRKSHFLLTSKDTRMYKSNRTKSYKSDSYDYNQQKDSPSSKETPLTNNSALAMLLDAPSRTQPPEAAPLPTKASCVLHKSPKHTLEKTASGQPLQQPVWGDEAQNLSKPELYSWIIPVESEEFTPSPKTALF